MKPLSESRFLQSILAVAASVVLVCGALILLTSTSPWTPRDEAEAASPAPASASAPKTGPWDDTWEGTAWSAEGTTGEGGGRVPGGADA